MMLVMMGMMAQTVSAVDGQEGGSMVGDLVVVVVAVMGHDGVVAGVMMAVQTETVVTWKDTSAGHGQHAQDGDKTESHFCYCFARIWRRELEELLLFGAGLETE